jgi:hypothetical protein
MTENDIARLRALADKFDNIAIHAASCHTSFAYEDASKDLRDLIATFQPAPERENKLVEALRGIIEIGKRDMTNPKYDGYFDFAREALAAYESEGAK